MSIKISPRNNYSDSSNFPIENRNTYLHRCRNTIKDSELIAKREERYALAYKVGAYALATFFVVAAVTALVLTGIYLPIFLPATGISILVLTDGARRKVQNVFTRATLYAATAKRTRAIALEAYLLRNESNLLETQSRISKLVPSLKGCLARRMPLLAHFNYWEKEHADYTEKVAGKLKEAERTLDIESRNKICVELSKLRQKASQAKTAQAFLLAVMQKPHFEGNPEELCSLNDFSIPAHLSKKTLITSIEHNPWTRNAILKECGQSAPAVVFHNKKISPITFDELQHLSAQILATRYLQAMS